MALSWRRPHPVERGSDSLARGEQRDVGPTPTIGHRSTPSQLLHLQRAAGNRAVDGEIQRLYAQSGVPLQRAVRIGKGNWLKENAKLPAIPPAMEARYQSYVVDQVRRVAAQWRDDATKTPSRVFGTADLLYQALFDHVISGGAGTMGTSRDGWMTLKAAVEKSGNLTEVPWGMFGPTEGPALELELLSCPVQVSSNPRTRAFHANTSNKLPKKVAIPTGEDWTEVPGNRQKALTPYIEFLVSGRKGTTGIERGILDRDSGQIYLTAHYDRGSFVWLSGAPATLVADWTAKATAYRNLYP